MFKIRRDKRFLEVLYYSFLAVMIYGFWFVYSYRSFQSLDSFLRLLYFSTLYLAITYIDGLLLFRLLFLRGRKTSFIVASLLLFIIGSLLLGRIYEESWQSFFAAFTNPLFYKEVAESFILCIIFSGFCISFILFGKWIDTERKVAVLAQAKLTAELENLKSQISPHFLFNTLNNLYVLAKTKPAKAADAILELSELIRYQIYECNSRRVPLKREVEYIGNLLALEQLRKEDWLINTSFPSNIPDTLHIEPLLFIALIENAIKHGSQQLKTGAITATLILTENELIFEIVNSKPSNKTANLSPDGSSIGISNLKKRLDILYPKKHTLDLTDNTNIFTAKLTLSL
jgi:sensor histidine kinase YesM